MSIKVAKLILELEAKTSEADAAMRKTQMGFEALGQVGGGALKAVGAAALGLGVGLVALGREALGVYGNFERMSAALQQLQARELLVAGEAETMSEALKMTAASSKELLGWTQELAIKSPFTQEGVTAAFKMQMAYGFTTEEAKRLTEAMIDFSAGTGASEYSMQKISLALGQIRAKGKLAGGEVLQLTEAGIGVNEVLAKAFGKTTQEIVAMREDGLIPADAAIEAIVQDMETNFAGAAERQAGTIQGLVASLEDLKAISLRGLFGPLFEEFKPELQAVVDMLQDPKTIESIRAMGTEFATSTRSIITEGGKILTWFGDLEGGTQAAAITLGIVALNAGSVIKLVTGLGLIMQGTGAAITATIAAWNAGLSLTTALQVGLGVVPVTLGAIALAVGAVAAIWVSWNEQIVKTERLGNEGVKSAFGSLFDDLRHQGKNATQIVGEFSQAWARTEDEINKGGVAGWFIDRSKLATNSLKELDGNLVMVTDSYTEYRRLMMEAADATGILSGHQAQMILQSGDQARINEYLAKTIGLRNEAEFESREGGKELSKVNEDLYADSVDLQRAEQRRMRTEMEAATVRKRNLAQDMEIQAAKARMIELDGELVEASKKVAEAEFAWSNKAGQDIISQLEQAGIKGSEYEEALGAIDEMYGTTFVQQHEYMKDVQALVAEYKQHGNLATFKTKLGELREQFQPMATEVATARLEMEKLRAEYDSLVSKTIYIKVVSGSGPQDGGGTGENCFAAGTLVDTPAGPRPIEQILVGERVHVYTSSGSLEETQIVRLIRDTRSDLVRVSLSDGVAFAVAPNHPVLVLGTGWVLAVELRPGMALDGPIPKTVKTVELYPGKHPVYNFEVAHPEHTYLVHGVVVHNAEKQMATGGLLQPGQAVEWNEHGREMLLSPVGGYVLNAIETSKLLDGLSRLARNVEGGGGGGAPVNIFITESGDAHETARKVVSYLEARRR